MDSGPNGNGNVNSITVPITVTVLPVNQAPTLTAITPATITLTENGTGSANVETPISLSGITDGLGDTGQILSVTATSSNPAVIPNPASATATLSGGRGGGAIRVNSGGSGYALPPVVTLTGGGFTTPATATAVLGTGANAGVVTGINFTPGRGLHPAPGGHNRPANGHRGRLGDAQRRHRDRDHDQRLGSPLITITNQGSGYSSTNPPVVTIAPPVIVPPRRRPRCGDQSRRDHRDHHHQCRLGYFDASPPAITIDPAPRHRHRGHGHGHVQLGRAPAILSPPVVTINGGSGSDATATAVLTNGMVTGFTITNPGLGLQHLGR